MQPSPANNFALAFKDVKDGFCSIYVWPMLGWQEIKQRYRRSVLGPFWLTISTGAMIGGMGPLYGRLLGQEVGAYLPYLGVGLIVWFLIANLINESCYAFIAASGYIQQIKLPLTVHILRVVYRNLIIFAHNLLIVALILVFYQPKLDWTVLLTPIGVGLIALNGVWLGILLGLLCARFRDIPQFVSSLVQLAFFLTPVIWKPEMLGRYRWGAEINPLSYFLEIVRAPLLGEPINLSSWITVLAITFIGYAVTLIAFSRFRTRIAYWV
jgi:ABC-type polysaccharide/polyol phosphate export permease